MSSFNPFDDIDPIGTVPVFIAVTRHHDPASRRKIALLATLAAAGILMFFVVDELTGDASFQLAQPSPVGFASVAKRGGEFGRRPGPAADPDARGRVVRRDGGSRASE